MRFVSALVVLTLCLPIVFAEPPAKERPATQEILAEQSPEGFVKKTYDFLKKTNGRFFQSHDRVALEGWLTNDLAALFHKDTVNSKDGVGVLEVDPLYNVQSQIADLRFKTEQVGGATHVIAIFKNSGEDDSVIYVLEQAVDKGWRIADIRYKNDTSLKNMLQVRLK